MSAKPKTPKAEAGLKEQAESKKLMDMALADNPDILALRQASKDISPAGFAHFCKLAFSYKSSHPKTRLLRQLTVQDPRFDPLQTLAVYDIGWRKTLAGNKRLFGWACSALAGAGDAEWLWPMLDKSGNKQDMLRLALRYLIESCASGSPFPALDQACQNLLDRGLDLPKALSMLYSAENEGSPLESVVHRLCSGDPATAQSAALLAARLAKANPEICLKTRDRDRSDALSVLCGDHMHRHCDPALRPEAFKLLLSLGFDASRRYNVGEHWNNRRTQVPLALILTEWASRSEEKAFAPFIDIAEHLDMRAKDEQGRSAMTILCESAPSRGESPHIPQLCSYLLSKGLTPDDAAPRPELAKIVHNQNLLRTLESQQERMSLLAQTDSALLDEALEIAKRLAEERAAASAPKPKRGL